MALLIKPVIDKLLEILAADATSFVECGKLFTGAAANLPALWVMPGRTVIDQECSMLRQTHLITIKFGVQDADPDALMNGAMDLMAEIHGAIEASWPGDWVNAVTGGQVQNVTIREHDYGPTWTAGGLVAKFPEMDLVIEVEELREES
jgi:hypothetical protein